MLIRAECMVLLLWSNLTLAQDSLPPPPPPPPVEPEPMLPPPPPPSAPAPRPEDFREGDAPPPGYHYETVRAKGALIAGASVLGVGYVLSNLYGFACMTSSPFSGLYRGDGNLAYLVPVAGPLLRQGIAFSSPLNSGLSSGFGYSGINAALDVLLTIVFTAAEFTGAAFTVVGIFKTSKELVPDEPRWSLSPVGPSGTAGASFTLVF